MSELTGKLERSKGESKGDFEKRLLKVSNKKLLHLLERSEESKKFGGRKDMVENIHDYQAKLGAKKTEVKEDKGFKDHLNKKTIGFLVDRYKTIQKRLRQEA